MNGEEKIKKMSIFCNNIIGNAIANGEIDLTMEDWVKGEIYTRDLNGKDVFYFLPQTIHDKITSKIRNQMLEFWDSLPNRIDY
jgi:hypothetical protein